LKSSGKLSSVILWSVISAAFIGPGTITMAITAGSLFQIQLLWAVLFATIACIFLQEVSARITIASGLNFGQTLIRKYGRSSRWIKWMIAMPVLLGCAAYEAGNILGAVSGISLLAPGDGKWFTIAITIFAGIILWKGGSKILSLLMTGLVGIMGIAFLTLAVQTNFSFLEIAKAAVVPTIPKEGEWLTLALIGTTIVPYSIFIGSAISKGNTVPLMRIGLSISVIIGGLITAWIMIAGSLTGSFSSFGELAINLNSKIGMVGNWALGLGLFAAGLSSAITSPYAASLIASTVLGAENKRTVRAVWMLVLLTGFLFGISGIKPIPVILSVQALNGFVLPLLTYFLILIVNDATIIAATYRHAILFDCILVCIFGVTLLIGLNNVDKAITTGFNLASNHFEVVMIVTGIALVMVIVQLVNMKKRFNHIDSVLRTKSDFY
jgi:Mn2+/Fe2+ NRAMP family transporter